MIIQELQLKAFGKFHNKTIAFQPAMNIIEGQNEAGKSTIHAFIGAVLFGIDRNDKLYKKYKPWLKNSFCGAMKFQEGDAIYYLERDFMEKTVALTRVGFGNTVNGEEAETLLHDLLGGLTRTGYVNTVSINQMKGTTDDTIAEELKSNLENLSKARSTSLNFKSAEESLKRLREAAQSEADEYDAAEEEELKRILAKRKTALSEANREGWIAAGEMAKAAEEKKKAYEEYESKREALLDMNEQITRERDEIRDQQELWKKTDDKVKLLMAKNDKKIRKLSAKGKDTVKAFKPSLAAWWILVLLLLAAGTAGILGYFFWQDRMELLAGGIALAAMSFILFIVNILRIKHYNRRKSYYRSILERRSRQEEYYRAGKALDEARDKVYTAMSEEQTGEYMTACERLDKAGQSFEKASINMQQAVAEHEAACRALFISTENRKRHDEVCKKLEAIDMAWEHIYKAGEISVNTFGQELKLKAGEYLSDITGGKYTGIEQDAMGNVYLTGEEGKAPVSAVSRGTMEQVYLTLRLAAASLLSPKVSLPILLDDTFAYYDDKRTERALRLLKKCGHQIILMTCQSREQEMLKRIN